MEWRTPGSGRDHKILVASTRPRSFFLAPAGSSWSRIIQFLRANVQHAEIAQGGTLLWHQYAGAQHAQPLRNDAGDERRRVEYQRYGR